MRLPSTGIVGEMGALSLGGHEGGDDGGGKSGGRGGGGEGGGEGGWRAGGGETTCRITMPLSNRMLVECVELAHICGVLAIFGYVPDESWQSACSGDGGGR